MKSSNALMRRAVLRFSARAACAIPLFCTMLSQFSLAQDGAVQFEVAAEVEGGPRDTLFQKIAEYRKVGDAENAVKTYDELLQAYPDYGKDTGGIISLLHQRADAHGYKRGSPERLELLREIWDDYSETSYPQIFNIGRMVVLYAQGSGENEIAFEYSGALLEKLQREFDDYSEEDIDRYGIDSAYQEALYYRSGAARKLGKFNEAKRSLLELIELFPESPTGRSMKRSYEQGYLDLDFAIVDGSNGEPDKEVNASPAESELLEAILATQKE